MSGRRLLRNWFPREQLPTWYWVGTWIVLLIAILVGVALQRTSHHGFVKSTAVSLFVISVGHFALVVAAGVTERRRAQHKQESPSSD